MSIERVIVGIRELEAERTKYKKQLEAVKKWFIEYGDTKIEKFDHPWRKLSMILGA